MIISALDTYYHYIRQRMIDLTATVLINGSQVAQPMGGISNAQDWPQVSVEEGQLQLLLLTQQPTQRGTQAVLEYVYFVQWVWILIGQDIQASQQAFNRGDRYRADQQIIQNLRNAHYPGFCNKSDFTVDSLGVVTRTPATTQVPNNNFEAVRWTMPVMRPKLDTHNTGMQYNAAAVELYAWDTAVQGVTALEFSNLS